MKKYIPYILIIFFAVLSYNFYVANKSVNKRLIDNNKAQNSKIKYLTNKWGEEKASKLAVQLTNTELRKQAKGNSEENKRLKEAIKDYKKVIATIQTTQVVKIDTIKIPFKDTIACVFSKDFEVRDKWYQFNQNITNKGFTITDFELTPNKQDIVVGWKKQGWFKNPLATVEITNSNPLFNQVDIKPIIIVYNKKWHEKWYVTIPSAFALGYVLSN